MATGSAFSWLRKANRTDRAGSLLDKETPMEQQDHPGRHQLSLWYLAAMVAQPGDTLSIDEGGVAVANSLGVPLGRLEILDSPNDDDHVVIDGVGWFAVAMKGTSASSIEPISIDRLENAWSSLNGRAGSTVLLSANLRSIRLEQFARMCGLPIQVVARLLNWTDAINDVDFGAGGQVVGRG